MYSEITKYRFDCIKAARDLGYSKQVIEDIKKAESVRAISDIMKAARKGEIKK